MAGKRSKKRQVHLKTPFSASKIPPPHPPACNPEVGSPASPLAERASPPAEPACHSSPAHPTMDAPVKMCRHLERGVNIDKLSFQLSKPKFSLTHCQDCAKDSKSGTGKKGKGRSNKKKAGTVIGHSTAHLQKSWVCLACGHVACGAPATHSYKRPEEQESNVESEKGNDNNGAPIGHAWKHSLLAKHPLALQVADSLICWCFMCNMAVDCMVIVGASSQLASSSSPLQAAVKVVHEKLVKETGISKDPGKNGFAGEPVRCIADDASESSSTYALHPSSPMSMHVIGTRRKRTVKGLMNLGNTCFFNSVMQNLLALDMLRDYFSRELPDVEGPLTSSLRKLYLETNLDGGGHLSMTSSEASGFESGLKRGGKGRAVWESNGGACNPRSLFGAICAKAPRFRGFQQQDSHELLRCLLDGLTSEERNARARSTCNVHSTKGPSASAASRALMQNGECSNSEPSSGERECKSLENTSPSLVATTTFVESFFGGQLCSMVRCCECGHSSVVYEPMLDLSLQIPTSQTLRKGQKYASQWKPSSFGGGSQQRDGKHTKVPPIPSLQKVPKAAGLAVVETNKSSLQVGLSAQVGQTPTLSEMGDSSPKLVSTDNSALDDLGWLDFISGGMQSAESCIQGCYDALNSSEISENNLVVDVEDCIAGKAPETASHSSTFDEKRSQNENKAEGGVSEKASDSAMPSAGVQDSKLCFEPLSADTPQKSPEGEDEKHLVSSEGEDGPLPLASGIVLLPYEPLEVSGSSRGEESIESAVKGSTDDVASPPLEPEGGDLDGFSQLFEEEESCSSAADQKIKPSGGNLDDYQVIEESGWVDGSWEADTAAYGMGKVAAGPQKLAAYEDSIVPMSLESCLADFTKPELLCGENAWECESCTRRLKERALFVKSARTTDNLVSSEDMRGGGDGDLEKTVTEPQGKQELACFTSSTGGNSPEDDHSKCDLMCCTDNNSTDQAFPVGCKGLSDGLNESMSGSPSVCVEVDRNMEENQNGSAHLSNIDVGPLCGSQSPLCQVDSNLNTERIADMPKPEQNSKFSTQDSAGSSNLHSFASDPSVEKEAQGDCIRPECARSMTLPNSNKEKLTGPLSKSSKEAKSKAKSRQHPEKLVKKDATKKLSISKAPPILTVHLKRFAQDMRGRLSKLSGHVAFPEFLDLWPFLDPRCLDSSSCYYQLVGVVEHGGTMRGGHYIAYVRSPVVEETSDSTEHESKDFWYCISDSSVRKASLQAVLNSEAYLLFYEKCDVKKED